MAQNIAPLMRLTFIIYLPQICILRPRPDTKVCFDIPTVYTAVVTLITFKLCQSAHKECKEAKKLGIHLTSAEQDIGESH